MPLQHATPEQVHYSQHAKFNAWINKLDELLRDDLMTALDHSSIKQFLEDAQACHKLGGVDSETNLWDLAYTIIEMWKDGTLTLNEDTSHIHNNYR